MYPPASCNDNKPTHFYQLLHEPPHEDGTEGIAAHPTPSWQSPEPPTAEAEKELHDADSSTRPQVAPSLAYPNISQTITPIPSETTTAPSTLYNWQPFHELVDQQRKDDLAQRRNEHIQTTKFINSLRRAVDHNVRNRNSIPTPNMHNLPNCAYNQTTKELARLHQQDDYVITRPESTIHDSHTHLRDHIEHHVFEFQRHRIQVLQENAKRVIYLNPE